MPLSPLTTWRPSDLVSALAGQGLTVVDVARWTGSAWSIYHPPLPLNNGPMATGLGYLYRVSGGGGSWLWCGDRYTSGTTYGLIPGWNFVGLTCYPGMPTYTALQVVTSVNLQGGAATDVARWTGTGWAIYHHPLPLNNFTLGCQSGYFIRTTAASTWAP